MTGYVTINLLSISGIKGVFTGKRRTRADGKIEAEFMVITPGVNQATVWATREDLSPDQT